MTPGQLIKAVALALDVPEETVFQHDRNLAQAGLRTKGGRGSSAPEVTTIDAARLLVATLASVRTKESVATVKAFEETEFEAPTSFAEDVAKWKSLGTLAADMDYVPTTNKFSDPAIMALPADHNLVEAIAALIAAASLPIANADEYLQRFAPLIITSDVPWIKANIGHMVERGGSARYRIPLKASAEPAQERVRPPPHEMYARRYGIIQKRDLGGTAIMLLGKAFRENGLPFKTTEQAIDALLGVPKKQAMPKKTRARTQ